MIGLLEGSNLNIPSEGHPFLMLHPGSWKRIVLGGGERKGRLLVKEFQYLNHLNTNFMFPWKYSIIPHIKDLKELCGCRHIRIDHI